MKTTTRRLLVVSVEVIHDLAQTARDTKCDPFGDIENGPLRLASMLLTTLDSIKMKTTTRRLLGGHSYC